jgi:hypothetical protein
MKLSAVVFCALLVACASPAVTANHDERPAIEAAARTFFAADEPDSRVSGLALHKIDDDLYLVGASFKPDDPAVNVVARRFHSGSDQFWKVERLDRNWKRILRLDE